jgi:hypothetical protein
LIFTQKSKFPISRPKTALRLKCQVELLSTGKHFSAAGPTSKRNSGSKRDTGCIREFFVGSQTERSCRPGLKKAIVLGRALRQLKAELTRLKSLQFFDNRMFTPESETQLGQKHNAGSTGCCILKTNGDWVPFDP